LPLRYALAIVCAIVLAPLVIVLSFYGVITLILFWLLFLVWVAREIVYARFVGNAILVSDLNYPRIMNLAREVREILGVRKDFCVFVYQQGEFNAWMVRLFFRRAIFLNSEILETGVSDDEVRWVVGRFVGYWRVQQDAGPVGWAIRMTERLVILNLLLMPYERAMVFTGDRLGMAAIGGDISSTISAMQKLLVGRLLGYSVNPVGVIEQAGAIKGSIFAFLARVGSAFPHTITRYVDLIAFAKRRYPEQFARFDAANPGLPGDLDRLSGERTSAASMLKLIGAIVAAYVVLIITLFLAMAVLAWVARGRLPLADLFHHETPTIESSSDSLSISSNEAQPSSAPAPADQPSSTPSAETSPAPLNDPVVVQGIDPTALASAYPAAARVAAVSGDVTVICDATADGEMSGCRLMSENPTGYGFGDAALSLASQIRIAPQGKDGSPVAGRSVEWDVPFKPDQTQ
jgi:hypothetical protein